MLRRSLVVLAAVAFAFTAASCSDSGGSVKEFCSLEDDTAFDNAEEPDDIAKAFAKAKDKAPDEIKKDVEIVADAFTEYAEKTKDIDPSDTEALTEASAAMSEEKVTASLEKIEKFSEENCK